MRKTLMALIAPALLAAALLAPHVHAAGDDPPIERRTGLKIPKDWDYGVRHVRTGLHLAGVLPAHFDWREKDAMTPVKNQKTCGSCWAHASTGSFESAVKIKDGKELDLSEQDLVANDKSSYGCSGGFFAHQFQKDKGQALEAACPYTARDSACPSPLQRANKLDDWGYVGRRGRRPTQDELKTSIYQHGPVAVTVAANGAMVRYGGGVFKGCTRISTNHMVDLVGWDDAEGVWYMRNSWGKDWGEAGYMKIPYGCSRIGEQAAFVSYKPVCPNVPKVQLPARLSARGAPSVEIGVEAQADAFYTWLVDGHQVANRTSKLRVKPRSARTYTLRVTTECGEAESTTRVEP